MIRKVTQGLPRDERALRLSNSACSQRSRLTEVTDDFGEEQRREDHHMVGADERKMGSDRAEDVQGGNTGRRSTFLKFYLPLPAL